MERQPPKSTKSQERELETSDQPNMKTEENQTVKNLWRDHQRATNNGIIEEAPESPVPHKPVVRESAESTKLQIVYDTSARAHPDAPSLNDCLNTGPALQNRLRDVLVPM